MHDHADNRTVLVFALLSFGLVGLLLFGTAVGSVRIRPEALLSILLQGGENAPEAAILFRLRLPRVLLAALLGGALSLSGCLMQAYFRNPIAGPFVLGISSGAKLTVALTMITALSRTWHLSSWSLVLAAFAGALISMGFVLLAARSIRNMSMLLVAGIMISYICSAVTEFLVTFAEDSDIANLHSWSQGSFSGANWSDVGVSALIVGAAMIASVFLAKPMGAWLLGESYAKSVGVNVRDFRLTLILLASLLAGCCTAFAGPVSFVGIAVPNLARLLLKTERPQLLLPACVLLGAVFCLGCDIIARCAFAPLELSISTVTALFGAPVVIALLIRRSKKRQMGG